jgi:uncharacterized protein YyaL (SSP411 family)
MTRNRQYGLVIGLIIAAGIGVANAADKPGPANRLAKESSPYLRQHAHNPVNWYPWGPEAFEKAKKENKLVFLSIGYSSCHWCHVMERESFENAEVAKILNDSFVCIKVDREERPDIDEIYMTALHVFRQSGGWPLSMFLTPEAKPIVGGTYWPPDDRVIDGETVKGFKSILKVMKDVKEKQPKELADQAEEIAKRTQARLEEGLHGRAIVTLERKLIADGIDEVIEGFDGEFGGFGRKARGFRGTKFPMPCYLELLLAEAKRTKNNDLSKALALTLGKMATGGIFDQIGGGFHRYSTERTWTVPHFEKMLYDNGQLAEIYARAYETDPKPLYARTIRTTLDFVLRELTAPEGAFYSALDADSEGEEGRFYVWTPKDLEQALPNKDELDFARQLFGVSQGLNFEKKYSILTMPESAFEHKWTDVKVAEKIEVVRKKLFDIRAKRERPFLDTKILTAWNGQMIAGFATAGRALKEPKYTQAAAKAADFVLANLRTKDGRLFRTYMTIDGKGQARLNGYLDDYAFLVHGLLALHDATNEKRWLDETKTLTDVMVKWHLDEKAGGYFYTSNDHEKLFARSKDQFDGAQPCGNSVAARNLVRLHAKTGDAKYRDLAQKSLETFAGPLKANPSAITIMLAALGEYLEAKAGTTEQKDDLSKPGGKATTSDSVVKVTSAAEKPDANGKQVVTITLAIDDGWHIYGNPVGSSELVAGSETTVKVSGKGKPKLAAVVYPKGKLTKEKVANEEIEYFIYEGKIQIKATIQRVAGDKESVELSVNFGACKSGKAGVCLKPSEVKLKVPSS